MTITVRDTGTSINVAEVSHFEIRSDVAKPLTSSVAKNKQRPVRRRSNQTNYRKNEPYRYHHANPDRSFM